MMSELSKQLNTVEEYVQLLKDIIRLIVDLKCKQTCTESFLPSHVQNIVNILVGFIHISKNC